MKRATIHEMETAKSSTNSRHTCSDRATVSRRSSGSGSVHSALVSRYVARGFSTHRFYERLATVATGVACRRGTGGCRCAFEDEETERVCFWRDTARSMRAACNRIPDAYRIDADEERVEILEVDITHHTSDRKLDDYAALMGELDLLGAWQVVVILVDRFGVERTVGGEGGLPWPRIETMAQA